MPLHVVHAGCAALTSSHERLFPCATAHRVVRIVGGVWAGTPLVSPAGRVRPTAEDMRTGWMQLHAAELEGARVLDLFAGTGALGLEALSRGARTADFVENGAEALHALKANVAKVRAHGRTRIFKKDAIPFFQALPAGAYDIAFADPPYGSRKADLVIERWLDVPFSAVLAVEHDGTRPLPGRAGLHPFGDVVVSIYRRA